MENRIKNQIEATISVCANGHDVYAVMLNGFRLFGSKCCGSWTVVRKYKTTLAELREDLGEAVPELIGAAPTLIGEEREDLEFASRLISYGQGLMGHQRNDPVVKKYLDDSERAVAVLDRLLGASR